MKPRIYSVNGDADEGFHLDEKFFDRTIGRIDAASEVRACPENLEVAYDLIAAAAAEFMNTFGISKN